jgi:hypothetical protein
MLAGKTARLLGPLAQLLATLESQIDLGLGNERNLFDPPLFRIWTTDDTETRTAEKYTLQSVDKTLKA